MSAKQRRPGLQTGTPSKSDFTTIIADGNASTAAAVQ